MGIDLGLQPLATIRDGEDVAEIANPKPLQSELAELRRVNKVIDRLSKVHGNHNHSQGRPYTRNGNAYSDQGVEIPAWQALYAERQRLYAKGSNIRSDHHHNITTAIAKRGSTVKVDPLNISGMAKNSRLARAFNDAGMGEFLRMLAYKCDWYGTTFVNTDRRSPSLKTCSACGAVKRSRLLPEHT